MRRDTIMIMDSFRIWMKTALCALALVVPFSGAAADWTEGDTLDGATIITAKASLRPLVASIAGSDRGGGAVEPSPELETYRRFYGLDRLPGRWKEGYVATPDFFRVCVQIAEPYGAADVRPDTVVLVHGYLKHAGYAREPAAFFLERGYRVILMDLPGHGLSDGYPGHIDDFAQYAAALRATLDAVKDGGRLIVCGHSTGGATAIELVDSGLADDVDAVALFAPLVRSAWWWAARFGLVTVGRLAKDVGRPAYSYGRTADWDRLENALDPLVPPRVPLGWGYAVGAWNDRLYAKDPSPWKGRFVILQGDRDSIVWGAWNVPFLLRRFKRVDVLKVTGATHDLWEEPDPYRSLALETALRTIENRNPTYFP